MRGYLKCLWYCQRGTRGFWRGVCDFSSVVLDATGTVVGSAGMVSEAMGWEDLKYGLVVGEATGGTVRGITHQRRYISYTLLE